MTTSVKGLTKSWVQENRYLLGVELLAVGFLVMIVAYRFVGPQVGYSWLLLAAAVPLLRISIGNPYIFWSLFFILATFWLSVPGTILWGNGDWKTTLAVAIWTSPAILFYLVKVKEDILLWLLPGIVLQSLFVIYQGVVLHTIRPSGLLVNAGPSAGILVLGIAIVCFYVPKKLYFLLPLLVLAVVLTGSRAPNLVAAGLIFIAVLIRFPWWIKVLVVLTGIIIPTVVLTLTQPDPSILERFRLDKGGTDETIGVVESDLKYRLIVDSSPSIFPKGYNISDGLHNVPIRASSQLGIVSAVLWCVLTLVGLLVKPWWRSATWWMLVSIALMSMVDVFPFFGSLAGFWWLVLGLRLKEVKGGK